jgi:hypothetical protein
VKSRAKHDIGEQQQLERHDIGRGKRQQDQSEMDRVVAAHVDGLPEKQAGRLEQSPTTFNCAGGDTIAGLGAPHTRLERQDFTAPAVSPPTM